MPFRSSRRVAGIVTVSSMLVLGSLAGPARATSPAPVALGTVGSFAVFGGSTVTSAGVSTLTGDIGVSPGTAVTGFPPGTFTGAMHADDAVAAQAHADLATAYADAAGRSPAAPITGDLGGVTLTPGVHGAGAALTLGAGGTLTLDAQGDPDGVFILQAGSTLGTGANSAVTLTGGAQACNVFWQVGSSATLGASSGLAGTILASTSISMGDGVTVAGRALARDGAVTLINDTVTDTPCHGSLSNTAPDLQPFTVKLTGLNQTVYAQAGAWNVTDATGSNDGYSITASATRATVGGSTAGAGTGAAITLTPPTATAAAGNSATTGPAARSAQVLNPTPATIENAVAGTGQGEWDFPADDGTQSSLALTIPGDASTGTYRTTLTFTTAPPVG